MRNVSDIVVEKIETHNLCSNNFSRKSYRLWDNVEKYGRTIKETRQAIVRITSQTLSCNYYCREKVIVITYSECVFVAFVIQHAKLMCCFIFLSVDCLVLPFFIHGSVHRDSILIRCNNMQAFIYCKITLHVSGVYRIHHQEYIKL